jgi:hypothetical protein
LRKVFVASVVVVQLLGFAIAEKEIVGREFFGVYMWRWVDATQHVMYDVMTS